MYLQCIYDEMMMMRKSKWFIQVIQHLVSRFQIMNEVNLAGHRPNNNVDLDGFRKKKERKPGWLDNHPQLLLL